MTFLTSSASIEINSEERLSPKDLHFLRQRLQECFNEAAGQALEEYGILTDNPHIIHIEDIEIQDDQPSFVD